MTPLARIGSTLYRWDIGLFEAIHPSMPPSSVMLDAARTLADGPLLITAGMLLLLAIRQSALMRYSTLRACALTLAALIMNTLIGFLWHRSRPFVAGVGHAWMTHAATSSFPSDHLTAQWTVAGALLLDRKTRMWGIVIALLGLPMAWARIYLGVHYPSDMLGAAMMGGVTTLVGARFFSERTPTQAVEQPMPHA